MNSSILEPENMKTKFQFNPIERPNRTQQVSKTNIQREPIHGRNYRVNPLNTSQIFTDELKLNNDSDDSLPPLKLKPGAQRKSVMGDLLPKMRLFSPDITESRFSIESTSPKRKSRVFSVIDNRYNGSRYESTRMTPDLLSPGR